MPPFARYHRRETRARGGASFSFWRYFEFCCREACGSTTTCSYHPDETYTYRGIMNIDAPAAAADAAAACK